MMMMIVITIIIITIIIITIIIITIIITIIIITRPPLLLSYALDLMRAVPMKFDKGKMPKDDLDTMDSNLKFGWAGLLSVVQVEGKGGCETYEDGVMQTAAGCARGVRECVVEG